MCRDIWADARYTYRLNNRKFIFTSFESFRPVSRQIVFLSLLEFRLLEV